MMKIYQISLDGCDDATDFEMEMTEEQFEFLKKVATLSKETSRYGCMPTMRVREKTEYLF